MSLVATDQTWDSYVQSKSDILAFIYIYYCLDKVPYISLKNDRDGTFKWMFFLFLEVASVQVYSLIL